MELHEKKRFMLNQIADARVSHTRWLRRAKHLIEGLPVRDGMLCLDPSHCEFGKWFYKEGVQYKQVLKFDKIVEKIEKYHLQLHEIYVEIYKIYFVQTKRSWVVSKLLASPYNEPSMKQKEMAKLHLRELEETSKKLLSELTALERLIAAVNEKQFCEFVNA